LPGSVVIVGCWAHARRKFDEALKGLPEKNRQGSLALKGKSFCDELFNIERELKDMSPEERKRGREVRANPVLSEFLAWLHVHERKAAPKSGIGKAIHYALEQWKFLEHYLLDGRLEISNNRAERSIKPFVIDRKNFLFANTPRGARASAVMFSLIETAKENGLNPYAYLTHIFRHVPNMPPDDFVGLLPYTESVQANCKAGAAAP
jgi:AraC-like DNA-binding protein